MNVTMMPLISRTALPRASRLHCMAVSSPLASFLRDAQHLALDCFVDRLHDALGRVGNGGFDLDAGGLRMVAADDFAAGQVEHDLPLRRGIVHPNGDRYLG